MKHFVIFIFIIYSCSNNTPNNEVDISFNLEKNINFRTGFNDFNGKIISFDDEIFMGFMNAQTYKKIVLHPINNPEKIIEIDLTQLEKRGEKIMDYEIISKDTILVLSWYTNKLFFINEKGEIWREKTIGPLKMNKMKCDIKFELTTLFNPLFINDSTLICGIEPYMDTDEFDNLPYAEFYEKLNNINAPRLVKIDNIFADSLNLTFGLDNFYKRFMKNTEDRREMLGYNFVNDKIICYSRYSDSIYIFDEDFNIENIVCIVSEITEKIGMEHIPLKAVEQDMNLISEMYLSQSIISCIHFVKHSKCYLVTVTHRKDNNNRSNWSFIALDTDFNLIGEYFFSEKESLIEITMKLHNDLIYIYKTKKDDFVNNSYNVYSLNFLDE